MKATETFKKIISDHLERLSLNDSLFAQTIKKANKNIDDCITYIFNTVKDSGCNGFADDEIFAMAVHYYDEDDIKVGEKINCDVVVNHSSAKPKEAKKKEVKPISKTEPRQQLSMF
ncbi:PcfK-like family protein [Sphingobacterium hungaricum]|uniref:PcfK-like protein n=1 Tax=Sphingobacterium hungaricum TaxID=2082723 RepID=A0A928UTE0_9SPHI|nr:PcfK-like family protein [Sphingobacterium hungaricum]MBE8712508.1 hypothetical protein [Sphingobacterium hungaricum]